MTHSEYITLCLVLLQHCYLYYELDNPVMQDYDYDRQYRKLVDYEESHPEHIVTFSPTQFVGFSHTLLEYSGGDNV